MKRSLLLIMGLFLFSSSVFAQTAGDIAFVGFNSDGDKDLAIVVLADLPNTTIYLTDNEWNGTAFTSGEGALAWVTGGTITAGTVVTFNDVNATVTVSTGSITEPDAGFNPTNGSEAIYAFLGTDESTPTTFLAAISNRAYDDGTTVGSLSNTGLTSGTEAVNLGDTDLDADVGAYNTFRQALSKTAFLALIGNASNWTTADDTGDQSATVIPFTTTAFEFTNTRRITGDEGWRMLSLPNTGGIVTDVSDDSPVQGITGGDDATGASNFFIYDNSGVFEEPTNVTTAWGDGLGFILYFFNNTTNGSTVLPDTLDVTGTEPSSNVTITLNKSVTSGGLNHFFTMAGNPFESNYDLNSLTTDADVLQDNAHFWNDGTSSYETGDRTGNYIVSPWQGFWLEVANAGTATTATFPTSGKSTSATSGTFFSKQNPNRADIEFTLSSETTTDKAIKLAFRSYAEFGMDRADASKLVPLVGQYATLAFSSDNDGESILKSVESLPFDLEEEVTVQLQPQFVGVSGEFTLSWGELDNLPNHWSVELYDFETGDAIDMRNNESYTFEAEATSNPKGSSVLLPVVAEVQSSSTADRFSITIVPGTSVSVDEGGETPEEFALNQNFPNPFNPTTNIRYNIPAAGQVVLNVYNVLGQNVRTLVNTRQSAGAHTVSFDASNLASGIYIYQLRFGSNVLTRKLTLIK